MTPPDPHVLLKQHFGYDAFRPGQREIIDIALRGGKALGVMPTGAGKSLCYQLPALAMPGMTLVVSPLIALMKDQVDELTRLGIPAAFINSSLPLEEQQERVRAAANGKYRLLYVAPERFRSRAFLRMTMAAPIDLIAIDEAHCVSEWGHDFRPDYLKLRGFLEQIQPRAIVALTATATPRVQADICDQLGIKGAEVLVTGFGRPNLSFAAEWFATEKAKESFCLQYVRDRPGTGIVYVGARKTADSFAAALNKAGVRAAPYHAGMEEQDRAQTQEAFMRGDIRVLAATNAFGMGIDKRDIRFVLHLNMPGTPEAYYQEAGRAGRDGLPAECQLCGSFPDIRLQEFFIDQTYPPSEQVRMVYRALTDSGENPVLLSFEEISRQTGGAVSARGVGSCLRILEGAEAAERLDSKSHEAFVATHEPAGAIGPRIQGPQREKLWGTLVDLFGEKAFRETIAVEELARRSGLEPPVVRRHLREMADDGLIEYHPPFRGRGVRILSNGAPFEQLAIPWDGLRKRRRAEEQKFEAMRAYLNLTRCRQLWIIEYFGERARSVPGCLCDQCHGGRAAVFAPIESQAPVRVPEARKIEPKRAPREDANAAPDDSARQEMRRIPIDPAVARAILRCLTELPRPLGMQKVLQIVRGSSAKWIADGGYAQLGSYGATTALQDVVAAIGVGLLAQKYALQTGGSYPTVMITEKGLQAIGDESETFDGLCVEVASVGAGRTQNDSRLDATESETFEMLRALRAAEAKRRRVLPFKVFTDAVLRQMAQSRPSTMLELININGIGPVKAKKYGEIFINAMGGRGAGVGAGMASSGDEADEDEDEDEVEPEATPEIPAMAQALSVASANGNHAVSHTTTEARAPAPAQTQKSTRAQPTYSPARLPDPLEVVRTLVAAFLHEERGPAMVAFERLQHFTPETVRGGMEALWDAELNERAQRRMLWGAQRFDAGPDSALLQRMAKTAIEEVRAEAQSRLASFQRS